LHIHAKPCILINTLGYWDGLLRFLDSTVSEGFLKLENRALLQVAPNASEAVHHAVAHFGTRG
jgi:predicted Rossmann-fold nucleotide-binding protein